MSKPDRRPARPRPVKAPRQREDPKRFPWKATAIVGAVAALLAASLVTPSLFDDRSAPAGDPHGMAIGAGDGPDLGSRIPFSERDVVSAREISSQGLLGRRTLLFFSEGVMCQACFVQIQDLEKVGKALEKQGVRLVSITPDPEDVLRQAIDQYAISTPMISDEDRNMSSAFDTLGLGMHSDTPGHAFVLLDETGTVVWQRDYWLAPSRTMYVEPARLLADLAEATSTT